MTTTHSTRLIIVTMYAGLGLFVLAMILPYVDHVTANELAEHIRSGYPSYARARIDSAATIYLTYLSVVGALGIASWLWTTWAVKAGKRWARTAATTVRLVCGTGDPAPTPHRPHQGPSAFRDGRRMLAGSPRR
jgi:hypothetical protein